MAEPAFTPLPDHKEPPEEQPHYVGHRDRLRQRFTECGESGIADYELLELLLFASIPRRDVKPLAKSLLQQFGSFSAVMHASVSDLVAFGLSENAAINLRVVETAAIKMLKQDVVNRPVLNNWARLTDYIRAGMAEENKEHFRLLFLNKKNELIADETQQTGTVDHTPAYPREIMKRALEVGATAIILVHNHPSGDPTPSRADIDMTKAIVEAGKPFSIVIHDHLIVSRNGTSSMRNSGLL